MPAPEQSLIVTAPAATLSVALEPAQNAFYSLVLLTKAEHLSGLGDWVGATLQAMSREEIAQHRKLIVGFYYAVQPQRSWSSFRTYLNYLDTLPPQAFVNRLLDMYVALPSQECQETTTAA